MRKKLVWAVLLCLVLAAVMPMTALAAPVEAGNVDSLKTAIAEANPGDTIVIPAGEYKVGDVLYVDKAVSFEGAGVDQTTIVGSIYYRCSGDSSTPISISGLTLEAPAGNTTADQAINWANNIPTGTTFEGVSLSVSDCKIVDFLFGIGVNSAAKGCKLTVTNLTLDNVWCGANVSESAGNSIDSFTVTDGSDVVYEVQVFGGKVANGYYEKDADRVAGNAPALTDNTKMPSIADGNWPAVAEVDGYYYGNLADAIAKAADATDKTVTLTDNVAIDSMLNLDTEGLVLDLAGHTINASGNFPYDEDNANKSHLVQILADNIQIKNGSLVATANNKHTLNVWGANGVVLEDLTLNHEYGNPGAPLVVSGSGVTVQGTLETITGANSWYAVNVDSRNISGTDTAATLKIAEGAQVAFEGESPFGIILDHYVEEDVIVDIAKDAVFTTPANVEDFIIVGPNAVIGVTADEVTILTNDNAGLTADGKGNYIPAAPTTPEDKPAETVPETGDSTLLVPAALVLTALCGMFFAMKKARRATR